MCCCGLPTCNECYPVDRFERKICPKCTNQYMEEQTSKMGWYCGVCNHVEHRTFEEYEKITSPQGGTRQPLGRRYDLLFEEFGDALDAWAEICHYGEQKHGNKNWWKLDFDSEQNPLNHAIGHLRKAAAAPPGEYRRRQLGKVLWNVAAQLWWDKKQALDDMPKADPGP